MACDVSENATLGQKKTTSSATDGHEASHPILLYGCAAVSAAAPAITVRGLLTSCATPAARRPTAASLRARSRSFRPRCIHASVHPCVYPSMRPFIHASVHPCNHASMRLHAPCSHAPMQAYLSIHEPMCPCSHTLMHTCMHSCMRAMCPHGIQKQYEGNVLSWEIRNHMRAMCPHAHQKGDEGCNAPSL